MFLGFLLFLRSRALATLDDEMSKMLVAETSFMFLLIVVVLCLLLIFYEN